MNAIEYSAIVGASVTSFVVKLLAAGITVFVILGYLMWQCGCE